MAEPRKPTTADQVAEEDRTGMHGPSPILGPDGQPYQRPLSLQEKKDLSEEVARPELIGMRTFWDQSAASGLTPERLAQLLRGSIRGDMRPYLELAEEMEERDPHYFSVLGTRKRALSRISASVEETKGDDSKIVGAVRDLVAEPAFRDMLRDLVDAFGKGYAAIEIMWGERNGMWWPQGYAWRDPKYFTFDYISRTELRLAELTMIDGSALPPAKFIVHRPKLKSGIPIRGGLARVVAWAYLFKNYSLKDWQIFLDVFGMPIRLGKYHPAATPEERRKLLTAVASIAVDAAAIIPDSMVIDFIEAKQNGGQPFENMCRYLDEQVSKAVLGQTMSTDGHAGGLAQAKIHNQVRIDILEDDADQVGTTINRDVIAPFVSLNWGDKAQKPRVMFPVAEPEDVAVLSDALAKLVPVGLRVSAQEVREKIGVREPEDGEEVLEAPQAAPEDPSTNPVTSGYQRDASLNRRRYPFRAMCPCGCGKPLARTALNAQLPPATEPDVIDLIGAEEASEWEPQLSPLVEAIMQAAAESSSYEEFSAALDGLAASIDVDPLAKRLMVSAMKARGFGDGSGPKGRLGSAPRSGMRQPLGEE
jgi:phage gp29-like protein